MNTERTLGHGTYFSLWISWQSMLIGRLSFAHIDLWLTRWLCPEEPTMEWWFYRSQICTYILELSDCYYWEINEKCPFWQQAGQLVKTLFHSHNMIFGKRLCPVDESEIINIPIFWWHLLRIQWLLAQMTSCTFP